MSEWTAARPVLIDTNVASYMVVRGGEQRAHWSRILLGQVQAISAQTRAELLVLPLVRAWGDKRTRQLMDAIAELPVVPVTDKVQEEYAELTAWGLSNGHAIGQPPQIGDRWVAATAIAHDLPLASADSDFDGIPRLVRFESGLPNG